MARRGGAGGIAVGARDLLEPRPFPAARASVGGSLEVSTNEALTVFDLVPPADVAPWMLRALKAVALADDDFDPRERRFLEVNRQLFGLAGDADHDAATIAAAEPEEVAAAIPDPALRRDLMQRLVVMSALDEAIHPGELELLRRFAAALAVDEPAIAAMQRFARGRIRLLALDLGRRSFVSTKIRDLVRDEGLGGAWKVAKSVLGVGDRALAERYKTLAVYPAGSLGRAFHEHCMRSGFKLPGERGAAPEVLVFHDLGHVLAGYGTDPAGEVEMGGFEAGYMGEDGFSVTLLVLLLFHLGADVAPGTSPSRGAFDVDRFAAAYRRGRSMTVDLRAWDPWPFMDQPVAKVADYLSIPPR